jgi:hypothetical protein
MDRIDIGYLLDQETNFTGATAQQAIDQGYIYFLQHGMPGQAGFGTKLMIDLNGGGAGDGTAGDMAIADLLGVQQNQLNASHFIV